MRTSRMVQVVRECLGAAPGGGVLAVSGGADSVALLLALHEAGYANLTIGHINHQLRGDESDADEQFVRDLAATLGLAFQSLRIDVMREAGGANLEATARRIRYQWLHSVAGEVGAAWIATGHTADDQAETVLHRLIRGTGLQGLRGIAKNSPPVVRPLLTVTRSEILEYLSSLGQPFRTDSSNADPKFTRNRIRAELLPLVKTFNPEAIAVLGRLAEQAEEAHAFIEAQARDLLRSAEKHRAGPVVIMDREKLSAAAPLLRREAFRLLWEREGWPMGEMSFHHWDQAATLAGGDFPGAVGMVVRERVVQLRRRI